MLKQIPENYQPAPNLLEGQSILITGAGDGIGAEAARCYAAHGATVIMLGRTVKKLEIVYDQIVEAGHPQPAIYPMDLEGARDNDYYDLADSIDKEFSRLDGLLHNAARLDSLMPLERCRST